MKSASTSLRLKEFSSVICTAVMCIILSSNLRPTARKCVHLVTYVVTSGQVTKMAVTPFNPP